ncbi:MAG: GMP/IMP nucleotidase [Gammaproteobacteria bacterium]
MIDWYDIDCVLLDMDGTLLDLYFDNYFWQEYLPARWGELHGVDTETAKRMLVPRFKSREGTLSWYCLDFWSRELNVDVLGLKAGVEDLIRMRPGAQDFLESLNRRGLRPVLVTNAHRDLVAMKLARTGIGHYFSHVISSHQYGVPKEEVGFWSKLQESVDFAPERTVLIDDNLTVLRAARSYGIAHLLSIAQPDSSESGRDTEEFVAIHDFMDVM